MKRKLTKLAEPASEDVDSEPEADLPAWGSTDHQASDQKADKQSERERRASKREKQPVSSSPTKTPSKSVPKDDSDIKQPPSKKQKVEPKSDKKQAASNAPSITSFFSKESKSSPAKPKNASDTKSAPSSPEKKVTKAAANFFAPRSATKAKPKDESSSPSSSSSSSSSSKPPASPARKQETKAANGQSPMEVSEPAVEKASSQSQEKKKGSAESKETKEVKPKDNDKEMKDSDDIENDSSSKSNAKKEEKKGDESDEEEEDETQTSTVTEDDSRFDPVKSAGWKKGEKVPFASLAGLYDKVAEESKRLKIISLVSNFLRSVIALSPEHLLSCMYLCCGKIAPAYEGKELGVGDAIVLKSIAEATGGDANKLKAKLKEIGDLGEVAETSRSKQQTLMQPAKLTVPGVFKAFQEIGSLAGNKSGERKKTIIKNLLVSCRGSEAKYIVRSLQGNLRIGLAEKGVISALARAVVLTPPSATLPPPVLDASKTMSASALAKKLEEANNIIKQAYTEVPSYDQLIPILLQHGVHELQNRCRLTPGIPVQVMLGKPAKGIAAVLDKFAEALFTIEFKYDGERAQIHLLRDGSIRIYSRNSENHTPKYPDIQEFLSKAYKPETKDFIIDCEVVAWDKKQEKILPFQVLSTRKRKEVSGEDVSVQVCIFAFDILYANGQSYLQEPLVKRRAILQEIFHVVPGQFRFAEYKDTQDMLEIEAFLKLAIDSSCEGLMVKPLEVDATYQPAKRGWIKVKKDYLAGGDTLDLVPIGAFFGKGKRTGAYGSFLLACYDEEEGEYQSITKIGTGFSDEMLETVWKTLKPHEIAAPRSFYKYPESIKPDVWFEPCQVWEVLCADLSISPAHKAAIGKLHEDKGIALRFPRFIRLRDDKKPEQATSADQVVEMYNNQKVVSSKGKGGADMDD